MKYSLKLKNHQKQTYKGQTFNVRSYNSKMSDLKFIFAVYSCESPVNTKIKPQFSDNLINQIKLQIPNTLSDMFGDSVIARIDRFLFCHGIVKTF